VDHWPGAVRDAKLSEMVRFAQSIATSAIVAAGSDCGRRVPLSCQAAVKRVDHRRSRSTRQLRLASVTVSVPPACSPWDSQTYGSLPAPGSGRPRSPTGCWPCSRPYPRFSTKTPGRCRQSGRTRGRPVDDRVVRSGVGPFVVRNRDDRGGGNPLPMLGRASSSLVEAWPTWTRALHPAVVCAPGLPQAPETVVSGDACVPRHVLTQQCLHLVDVCWPPLKMTTSVNGQVAVPAGGQVKVPAPRVDQGRFVVVVPFVRASRMR
jgi:hypothetical protein